jgi:hypothetical protein
MQEVAAQKVDADIRAMIRDADLQALRDRAAAVGTLKNALKALDSDTVLEPQRRERLARLLNARIRSIETAGETKAAQKPGPAMPLVRKPVPADPSGGKEAGSGLEAIRNLVREGRLHEARQQADTLATRFPDNPAIQATRRTLIARDTTGTFRGDQAEMERRLAAHARDMDRSATPSAGEIDFPKDWAEKSKNRTTGIQLSAKEKALVKALNSTISVDFKNGKFEEIVDYISKTIGQPITLDRAALEEAQVTYDTPVTLQANGMGVRTVLRQLLSRFGLTYIINEQAIEITSGVRAKETMVVRSYYIGDILGNGGPFALLGLPIRPDFLQPLAPQISQLQLNQQASQLQITEQVARIIDTIQSSIDPQSWQKNGGSGTIVFSAPTASLVVRQSAEVHAMLSGGWR